MGGHQPTPTPAWRFLLPAAAVEVGLLALMAWWPGAAAGPWRTLLFAGAFAAYAVAALLVKDARGGAPLIWATAVTLRLVLLAADPVLSHDVYRYLWDGRVQLAGVNPFRLPPLHGETAALRTDWFAFIPDPASTSPYPPLAQMAFLGLAVLGDTVLQAKLLWVGLDLATGWMLGRVAHFSGRSRRLTQLLYLWSPLLVLEVAWNGDMVALPLFLLTLVVLLGRAPLASGLAAGLAAMAAPLSLAAWPPLVRRMKGRFALGCFVGAAAALAPYLTAPAALLHGVVEPFLSNRYLEGPFLLLDSALPEPASRLAAAAAVLCVSAWATAHRFRPERAMLWILGAALLVAPVLRPEHALWILPFAALRVARPWILFTGLAFLAYVLPPIPGLPAEVGAAPLWAQLAVWIPVLALMVPEGRKLMRERFPLPLATP